MPFLYTAVFSYLEGHVIFSLCGPSPVWHLNCHSCDKTLVPSPVSPLSFVWHVHISVGASCALLVLRCLEKRLAMVSWRQGPNSNVLLRFAQLCDPRDNQRVRSHKICICRAEQHLLPLFWIYFNIRRSSHFFIFKYTFVFNCCILLFNS